MRNIYINMKNIQKVICFILILLVSEVMMGQQDAQYTQYMYNMNVINPAYAGVRGNLSLNLMGRKQWVGIEGAPETATLSIHAPFAKSIGLGFSTIYDQLGPLKETNTYADFSYAIQVSEGGNLVFGIKAGATFQVLNTALLNALDPNDIVVLNAEPNKVSPNFGAGVYFYNQKFYIGASVPNMLKTKYFEKKSGYISNVSNKAHYFLTTGFVFEVSDFVDFKPSIMMKSALGSPISIDLSGNILFAKNFEMGLSYRFDDSISGMVGFNVNSDFRIGYAYDHTVNYLGGYNSGSHEVMLLYDFNRKKIKNPRWF